MNAITEARLTNLSSRLRNGSSARAYRHRVTRPSFAVSDTTLHMIESGEAVTINGEDIRPVCLKHGPFQKHWKGNLCHHCLAED